MNCRQILPLLDAFADGELEHINAWRIRRHLAGCAACSAELAAIQRFGSRVQAWNAVSAPTGLQSRIAEALPRPAFPVSPRRFPVRRVAVGLAGLGAAAAVFVWLIPGQPGRPTIAFADIEKAMASVKIMGWTEDAILYNADGSIRHHHVTENWVMSDPPAIARIRFPTSTQPYRTQLLENKQGVTEVDQDGKYNIGDNTHKVFDDVHREISSRAVTLDAFAIPGNKLPKSLDKTRKVLLWERTTLNGQPAVKVVSNYSFSCPYPLATSGLPPQRIVTIDSHDTLWIDSKTHREVQYETHMTTQGKPVYDITDHNISYDQMPPSGIFDNFPPPGAKVKDMRKQPK